MTAGPSYTTFPTSYPQQTQPLLADSLFGAQSAHGNAPTFITCGSILAQNYTYNAPITGFTITIGNNIGSLILNPLGTLASGTINLPVSPVDGQICRICSTNIITSLTIGGGSNTVSNAPSALAVATGVAFIYNLANTTWFRIY